MIKRRTLIIVALSLLFALGAPAIALYWLCYTESGLQWLAARVSHVGNMRLRFEGLQGHLRGPLSASLLEIDQQRAHIVVHDLRADVQLRRLLLQTIHIDYLEVGRLEITVKARTEPPQKRAPQFLPRWLRLQAERVSVDTAQLTLLNGRVLNAERIHLAPGMTSESLTVEKLGFITEQIELSGRGRLHAHEPLELAADIDWIFRAADQPQWAGRLELEGDLTRLAATGRLTQPFVADLKGALSDLTSEWHWDAQTRMEEFSLRPWSPDSKVKANQVALAASGNRDGFRIKGNLTPVLPATGPLDVSLVGNYADRTLRADELRIAQKAGKTVLDASGSLRFGDGPMRLDFKGTWRDFGWPLDAKPVASSARGDFELSGQLPYRFVANGELQLPQVPAATFASAGELDRDAVRFERLAAQTFGGELEADGELRWGDAYAWRLNARARDIDPATIDSRFPGRLTFRLAAEGVGFDREARWSAELRDLSGKLRSLPVSGHARARHAQGLYRIADSELHFGAAQLQAKGQYGGQHDLTWLLSIPNASQLMPDARGSLTSRGTLSGSSREPQVRGSLSAQDLHYLDYELGRLEANADVDLTDARASHLQVSAAKLNLKGRVIHSAEIVLDGRASAHQLSILADGDDLNLAMRTQSGYEAGTWRGDIIKLDVSIGSAALKLTEPARYAVSQELMELDELCLTGTSNERACARGHWRRGGAWSVAADVSGLPLKVLAAGSARQSQYSGVLALQATAQQEPGEPWTGKAEALFADGLFRYRRASGKMEDVRAGSGHASFEATSQRFSGEVQLDATEAASLHARATADRTAAADWRGLPLSGTLHAQTRELGFVPVLVPEIDRAAGKLTADLNFAGTLGVPEIEGSLVLDEGELDLYAVNLQLREMALRADLKGTGLKLAAKARAGKGVAEVSGGLEWRNRLPFGQIKLKGENLQLINVPEAQVAVSPDLRFRIDGRKIGVDGAVRVPHAFMTPADLSGAVLPSSDEVLVGSEPREGDSRFEVTVGVQLVLGKDVRVDSYGLEARIEGNIAAYVAPDEVSTATGELKIAEGKYSAYTRELDIERGRLIFTGGPVSDPGVDLRASKEFPEAVVGVNVRGTLRNPRLSFWSDPLLPQTQIASLIVTGGKLESFQSPTGANDKPGRDELLAQGSAILANQLGDQLGVDVGDIHLESDINDQTRLVLGRYLSPRFYVSYGISLTEAINTLKLRYTINDRWTIESEAGEARSADLEYKIER
ncbi:MAG TPA: translocation/assembly module TamB domain-containing protein [Steroidobacteraceae bacterium]|nr:translocation/assembly module TamB domain-containing protein [Steroidobacteraceae bacterium]